MEKQFVDVIYDRRKLAAKRGKGYVEVRVIAGIVVYPRQRHPVVRWIWLERFCCCKIIALGRISQIHFIEIDIVKRSIFGTLSLQAEQTEGLAVPRKANGYRMGINGLRM